MVGEGVYAVRATGVDHLGDYTLSHNADAVQDGVGRELGAGSRREVVTVEGVGQPPKRSAVIAEGEGRPHTSLGNLTPLEYCRLLEDTQIKQPEAVGL